MLTVVKKAIFSLQKQCKVSDWLNASTRTYASTHISTYLHAGIPGLALTNNFQYFIKISIHRKQISKWSKPAIGQKYWLLFCLSGSNNNNKQHSETVCVCVCGVLCACSWQKGKRRVASTVVVGVQTAVYLPSCNDCLTSFHEPLWPHYRCTRKTHQLLFIGRPK